MSEIVNSRRRLDKVTYTPLVFPPSDDGGAALQTAAAIAALGLLPQEAASAGRGAGEEANRTLQVIEELVAATDPPARLAASAKLGRETGAALASAVDAIDAQRERILNETFQDLSSLIREYQAAEQQNERAQTGGGITDRSSIDERQAAETLLGASPSEETAASALTLNTFIADLTATVGETSTPRMPAIPPPDVVATRLAPEQASVAYAAAAWADNSQPERARRFREIPAAVIPIALRGTAVALLMQGLPFLVAQAQKAAPVKSALTSRTLQPIGLLHLEQLVITPLEVERGELVYTLPLAPGERVTLSHKEWSLRQEEYTRFVQDYFENYSEQGVVEKTDIAVSSKSESEHTKTLSMSRPTGPGGATLADPIDTQSTPGDVTKEKQSQEQSRRDTKEITEKASSLAVRDQRISFTVATVSGTEDFTARLYENKQTNKVMIIDYFRRMRKWRNELFRTGIRLTYDVVLPDPGRRLRERWTALSAIDAELSTAFEFGLGSGYDPGGLVTLQSSMLGKLGAIATGGSFSKLYEVPDDIEEMAASDIEKMAREYGVTLPDPPKTLITVEKIKAITEKPPTPDGSVSFELTLDNIPDDARPVKLWIGGRLASGTVDQYMVANYWNRAVRVDANESVWYQRFDIGEREYTSKTVPVGFIVYAGATGEAFVKAALNPTPEAWRKWRSIAYAQIRQGAFNRWNEKRELLRQKRAALLKELSAPDTLSLRRMEREQIMYLVLEWLFPEFAQSAQVYQAVTSGQPVDWKRVLEYGEYIKFVHEAIDWDRILVLLYPYFWDRLENHDAKLYLDHADGAHKEFLRAGACRVVLAIKPGFEEEVISLLDKGELGKLTPASRYRDVVAAVQEAEAHFAQRRAAATARPRGKGELADPPASYGDLVGAWLDWTPTSAMDMDVTLKDLL